MDCVDARWDWRRANGNHYDWRVVKNCRSLSQRSTGASGPGYSEEPDYAGIAGMQRGAACRSTSTAWTVGTYQFCIDVDAHAPGCVVPYNLRALPNDANRLWVRRADNSIGYFSGGSPYLEGA